MSDKKSDNNNYYKKLVVFSVLILLTVVIMVAGISYAYFTRKIEGGDNTRVIIKSADILLRYEEGNTVQVYNIKPGWQGDLDFSIENYSSEIDAKYKIILEISSPFTDTIEDSFVYSLSSTSNKTVNNNNNNPLNISQKPMPIVTTELGVASITKETMHNYKLKIDFIENGQNQNHLQGKAFVGKIIVESVYE